MTAARYKVPASFLGLAGSRLGLDLLSLFKEDEQGKQGFEGFAPGFQTSSIEKGRGGVLGYKAPRMATRETTFQLMPETSGLGVNVTATGGASTVNVPATTTTQTPVIPEPKKDTRPGIASTYGASPVYFGHQDYFRNLELGYTPEEIKKYIQANPQLMNPASTNVQGKGGLYDQIMSGKVEFPGTASITPPANQSTTQQPTQTTSQFSPRETEIQNIYKNVLGRTADVGGLQHYASSSMSAQDIQKDIEQSPERRVQQVNALYKEVLGREADPGGLKTYTQEDPRAAGGFTAEELESLKQTLLGSAEYKLKNPGK